MDDSEELVRRCRKRGTIKANGKIHKNAFYFGYHEISVDRSRYRPYKETLKNIPKNEAQVDWCLIRGIVQHIRPVPGVEEIKANPNKQNPAHALIVCSSQKEKRGEIAYSLSKVFQKVPPEEYI